MIFIYNKITLYVGPMNYPYSDTLKCYLVHLRIHVHISHVYFFHHTLTCITGYLTVQLIHIMIKSSVIFRVIQKLKNWSAMLFSAQRNQRYFINPLLNQYKYY